MLSILKRELLSYFKTPLIYFAIVIYLLLSLVVTLFLGYYLQVGNSTLVSFFLFQPQVLANIIPAVTMKLWAEEKKNGTIELLLTQPLSYTKIVTAKFLAGWFMGFAALSSTFLFWGYSSIYLDLDNLTILSAYLSCTLVIGMFTAIGCVVSSLNKNVITAYVIALFSCWIIPYFNFDFLIQGSNLNPAWIRVVQSLNFYNHYQDMTTGQVGTDNILYFVVFIILAVWINKVIIETKIASHKYKRGLNFAAFVMMTLIIFIFTNIASTLIFGNRKLDLTTNKKYSLSDSTKDIVQKIEKPIQITIYLSSNLIDSYPSLSLYSQYVLRQLNKYASLSKNNLKIEIKDPQPYSDIETEAQNQHIKPLLSQSGKNNMYFGAVFKDDYGTTQTIPLFIEERQEYLEYDLSRLLYKFADKNPRTIGVLASPKFKDQYISKYLQNEYNVKFLSPDIVEVPIDVRSLIIVNPQEVSEILVYAIDQFVMRGGSTVFLLDPYTEQKAPLKSVLGYQDKTINKFLAFNGIEFDPAFVIGDIILGEDRIIDGKLQKFYPWIKLTRNDLTGDHILLKNLNSIELRTPGGIKPKENPESLFSTSQRSVIIPASHSAFGAETLLDSAEELGQKVALATAADTEFVSMFNSNIITNSKVISLMVPYLPASISKSRMVAIADSDFIFDDVWIKPLSTNFNEIYGVQYLNNNGEFLVRIIDYLNDDITLASITSKPAVVDNTPFEEKINQSIYLQYRDQYNQAGQNLLAIEAEVNQLNKDLETKDSKLSLAYMKMLNEKEEQYSSAIRQVHRYNYQMLTDRNHQINMVIVWNVVLIPIISLIVLLLVGLNIFLINKKRAQDITNEKP